MTTAPRKTRSIFIEQSDGGATIVDDIPVSAKITFGPVQPGSRDFGNREHVLRIYTSQNNQLAVFRNVTSFRDLSLSVRVREVTAKAETEEVSGPEGSRRSSTAETSGRFVKFNLEGDE
jgi:hypothetical protein